MAMASTKTERNMLCVICFKDQDVLKTVGECKHKFCLSCLFGHLEKYCSGRTFPCPSCQADCLLPGDGLDSLADFTGEEDDEYFDCFTDDELTSEDSGAVRNLSEECGADKEFGEGMECGAGSKSSGAVSELGEECGAVSKQIEKSATCTVRECIEDSVAVRKLIDSSAVIEFDSDCDVVREFVEEIGAVGIDNVNKECNVVENAKPVTDLTNLVGMMNCQICHHIDKNVQAINLCPECDQLYLCQKCTQLHGTNPATKTHSVVQLKGDSMCNEHKAPLTSYCCSCYKAACKICVMMNHGHHHVEKLSNLIKWKMIEVKAALQEREQELERLQCQEAQLVALKIDSQALDKQDALIKEIESHAEECVHEIITWKEIMKAEVKRDFKVIKELPEVLQDVSDSVINLQWGVSNVSEKLLKDGNQASFLDTLKSMHRDLDMLKAVSQAHQGVVSVVLCGLYQTPDYFVPSQQPSSIGQLYKSAIAINKAALPLLVSMEPTTNPSGRLESMSSWASVPSDLTTPTNNFAVDRVKQVVFRLTGAPGNLEEFMLPLMNDLNTTPVDLITVIDMINVIFEQAIGESNFTYTGARMCDWFSRKYEPVMEGEPIKFMSLILKRCQVEQANSLVLAQENPARLQGFTLFMAELFQNLKIVSPVGEARIELLGTKLKELVRILLQHPSDSNLKCVVRILKCTGAVLEDTERLQTGGQAPDMDNLIGFCMQQALVPTASESVRAMLNKVADIRLTNWGRMDSAPVQVMAPAEPRTPVPYTQSDPVFFDSYGRMITREEAGFGESELEYSYTGSDEYQDQWSSQDLQYEEQQFDPSQFDSSFDNGYLDTEIDDEIAAAFEQFLIDTQQEI